LIRRAAFLIAAVVLFTPPHPALAQTPPLAVSVGGGAARVEVGSVFDDPALEEALRSGIPLRLRFRTELWRDRFINELVDHATWSLVLAFEPLEGRFLVARTDGDTVQQHATYASARAAIEGAYSPAIRPPGPGRYYYLASLEIESLSLSDLEELGQWLRGELGPAVQGRRSVAGAVGTGLRRLLIRVLDLPTRRYHARSPRFEIG
jgi:hypothetical protein